MKYLNVFHTFQAYITLINLAHWYNHVFICCEAKGDNLLLIYKELSVLKYV
jgi:hypothetical protein